jgi:CubicO group peptidase (beta-lactamase class C family)
MRPAAIAVVALAACTATPDYQAPPLPRVDPAVAGFSPAALDSVTRFLEEKAAEGAFPGGVLVVGRSGTVVHVSTVGIYGEDDVRDVDERTIYDLASLTKVIGLTTAAMILASEGKLDLDRPVMELLPEMSGPGKEKILVRHLLTHTSGLEAWRPLHLETEDAEAALRAVHQTPLQSEPGVQYVYSDLGAITMTQVVERLAGMPLDRFLAARVFGPLGMTTTRYKPPAGDIDRIAPTERDPWRGRVIRGEVHDENTAHLGGVSGHAGLFSTGPDLARFAIWLLDAWHGRLRSGGDLVLPAELVREFTRRQPGPEGSTRALGWDTPTPGGGASSGTLLDSLSFGHTGFTGTSIWIDPTRDLFIILLTNRVHPTRDNRTLLPLRGIVADLVVRALSDTS